MTSTIIPCSKEETELFKDLNHYAETGNLEKVKEINEILKPRPFNSKPIILAAKNNHQNVVEYLMKTFEGFEFEIFANAIHHFELAKWLFEQHVVSDDHRKCDCIGCKMMIKKAAIAMNYKLMDYLVDECKISMNDAGGPLIHKAVGSNNLDAIKYILERFTIDPHSISCAATSAVRNGQLDMVKFLFSKGYVREDQNDISLAAADGYYAMLEFVESYGMRLNYDEWTLNQIIKKGHLRVLIQWLNHQKYHDCDYKFLMKRAKYHNNLIIMAFLFANKWRFN